VRASPAARKGPLTMKKSSIPRAAHEHDTEEPATPRLARRARRSPRVAATAQHPPQRGELSIPTSPPRQGRPDRRCGSPSRVALAPAKRATSTPIPPNTDITNTMTTMKSLDADADGSVAGVAQRSAPPGRDPPRPGASMSSGAWSARAASETPRQRPLDNGAVERFTSRAWQIQAPRPRARGEIEPDETEQDAGALLLSTGQKPCGAWPMKYATAISPRAVESDGCVNSPAAAGDANVSRMLASQPATRRSGNPPHDGRRETRAAWPSRTA